MNKARREIPSQMKSWKGQLHDTLLLKNKDTTLAINQSKKNKTVFILSSLHRTVSIGDGQKKKPETVVYYKATKFGVDVLDQMAHNYSTRCPSRRWPVHVFYNILDLASINAWILYSEATGEKLSRHDFNL
ncbi:uncharacterized protein [Palaemon carinicauda]|uniref:uncharacterized protein n=1 Tax=Palaemon carinicauda TaxID=392227 RepID=UPI0035B5F215